MGAAEHQDTPTTGSTHKHKTSRTPDEIGINNAGTSTNDTRASSAQTKRSS